MSVWSGFWIGIYCRADRCAMFPPTNMEFKIRNEETWDFEQVKEILCGACSTILLSERKMNLCFCVSRSITRQKACSSAQLNFPCVLFE